MSARARIYEGDASLAVVEASSVEELQRATGAAVYLVQDVPDWPVWAIVPAVSVADLLNRQPE
jgi:hypothetical protein